MRNEFLDEIADTLFAVAVAGAIGLGAAIDEDKLLRIKG